MFCTNCGNTLGNDAKFCPNCGTKIDAAEVPFPSASSNSVNEEKTVYDPFEHETDAFNSENSSSDITTAVNDILNDSGSYFEDRYDPLDAPTELLSDDPFVSSLDSSVSEPSEANKPDVAPPFEGFKDEPLSETPPPVDESIFGNAIKAEDIKDDSALPPPPVLEPIRNNNTSFDASSNKDNLDTVYVPQDHTFGNNPFNNSDFAPNNGQQFGDPVQQPYPAGGMVPPPAAEAPVQKKVGGGKMFIASIIAFITILVLLTFSLAVSVKFGASGSTLKGRIKKLNKNTLLSAEFDDDEVSNNIYKTLGFRSITDGDADKDDFKEYLMESDMLEYLGQNVKNYADYIIEGEGKDPTITSEDIRNDFFKENNDVAEDIFGKKLNKKALNKVQSRLEANDVDKSLSISEWNNSSLFSMSDYNYIFSYLTLGIMIAIVFLFLIWIALIVDRKGRHVCGFFGTIFSITGLLMFIIGVGVLGVCSILFAVTSNVIFYLIPNVLFWFGIIALCFGAGELFVGGIFRKISKSKKRKEKAAKAAQAQNPVPMPVQ